jgi:uncharacterized OsmC-like protein
VSGLALIRHTAPSAEHKPPALGGADAAPNTVEFALAGPLSCQAISYRFWAAKLDIPLDDAQLDVEGDPNVREFFGQQDGVRRLASR